MACPSLPASSFLGGVVDFLDCQAQAIGAGGYQALAAPGSPLSIALTGLLTLFVALFGYRMLFGQTPALRDGVLAMVKVGIVLALALSWPAYRTLIYDVALKGPAELASQISTPAALPGASGGLVARLDNADRFLVALAVLGPGQPAPDQQQQSVDMQTPPPPAAGFSAFALGSSRMLFLSAAIAALGSVRLVAGLLLALGPVFFAFLLFDATRGLFEGWLRVLGGAALGALGTAVVLGVELALLEPWLANLYALRIAGYAIPSAPVELLVVTFAFSLVLVAMLIAVARVAYGFTMPPSWRSATAQLAANLRAEELRLAPVGGSAAAAGDAAADRSRAVIVADAVAAMQRREGGAVAVPGAPGTVVSAGPTTRHALASDAPVAPPPLPLGQSFRRTTTRHSASATRRDRRS